MPSTRPPRRIDGRPSRLLPRVLAAVFLAACVCLVSTFAAVAPASAHARLLSVSPADGSTVTAAPTEVVLTFDEPPTSGLSVVVVKGPDGRSVQTGSPTDDGASVRQALAVGLAPGQYSVAWKAVSDDGHPVSGTTRFTLAVGAQASPPTTATTGATSATTTSSDTGTTASVPAPSANGSTTPPSSSPASSSSTGSTQGVLWLLALALVIVGVLGWARALRGRRGTHGGDV